MKKLSVVLVFLLMITVLVSCGINKTTKDVISKNEVDEVPQNNETIVPETETRVKAVVLIITPRKPRSLNRILLALPIIL